MKPYANYIYEYHAEIKAGAVIVGTWIRMIYEILVRGISDGVYFYDAKKANKAIRFIENFCHHSEGRSDLLKLELWQKALVAAIFGIVDADGIRQFREVFVVVARKNGKSLLASAIFAYMAYVDGEYGAKLYCIAPKLEQAEKVFDGFYQMVLAEDELLLASKKRRTDLYIPDTNTSVKPLAFNAKKSDGFNPQGVCCDEVASWPAASGQKQYEVMKSALGARKQPIIFTISTAGYINDGPYDELMKRSTAFLKGGSKERRLLPFIYMLDDQDKWNDMNELRKANPNMGVSVSEEFYQEEMAIAEKSLPKLAEFKCKYCNIKQNAAVAWLDYDVVNGAMAGLTLDDFAGCYAVGGIDLSQTTDLTAATVLIERRGVLYAFTKFFMPRERLEKAIAVDDVPYDIFEKEGLVQFSGDHYVNYRDVYQWFVDLREKHKIYTLKIGYDKYSAQQLVEDLKGYGYHMDDVWQGENLSPVLKEFEGILLDGNFKIAGQNRLLKAHFLNVALKQNMETRKSRPVKIEETSRIDGFVSAIDAMTVRQKYYNEIGYMLKNAA
ncbi:MAG: terminase large subunit [Clostridiales bacterium]|nr:terminase large subunit [Clostridiales bacterium]